MSKNTKSVLHILGTQVFLMPVQLVLGIVIARYLGPELKGLQSFAMIIFSFGCSIFLFGFTASTRYFISNNNYQPKDIVFTVLCIALILSFLFSSIILSLWSFDYLGKTGNEFSFAQIWIIATSILFTIFNLLLMRFLVGMSHFIEKNRITIIHTIFYILGAFLLVALDKGLTGILIAILISKFVYFSLFLFHLKRNIEFVIKINISFFKDAVSYGMKSWLSEIIRVSNRRIDQFIIGLTVLPEMLGIYAVAVMLAEICQIIPQSVVQVFFNKVAADTSKESRQQFLYKIHKGVFFTTLSSIIVMAIFGKWLVLFLYGESYAYSYNILIVYLPGVLLYMSTRIFLQYFASTGTPLKNALIQFIGLVIGIPSYLFLIPMLGIIGAAIGSSLAYSVTLIVAIYLFSKDVSFFSFKKLFLFNKEDIMWYKIKSNEVYYSIKDRIKR